MLLQFKVKNFQSIKEEAILSMVPSSDKSHPENLAHEGKKTRSNQLPFMAQMPQAKVQ